MKLWNSKALPYIPLNILSSFYSENTLNLWSETFLSNETTEKTVWKQYPQTVLWVCVCVKYKTKVWKQFAGLGFTSEINRRKRVAIALRASEKPIYTLYTLVQVLSSIKFYFSQFSATIFVIDNPRIICSRSFIIVYHCSLLGQRSY